MTYSPFFILTLIGIVRAIVDPPPEALVVGKGRVLSKVQEAIDVAVPGQTIFVEPGVYREMVNIPKHKTGITIIGSSSTPTKYQKNRVTIISDVEHNASTTMHSHQSGTLIAQGDDFKMYNVNILCLNDPQSEFTALSAYGDRQGYYACSFQSFAKTVLSAKGHHIFVNCFIEGKTHFIASQQGRAWFEQCYIRARSAGYITANGRDRASNPSIFVLNRSTLTGPSNLSRKVYLGRPWSFYSHVVVQRCTLGPIINTLGWQGNFYVRPFPPRITFAEFGNRGPGADGPRVSIVKKLQIPDTLEDTFGPTAWIDIGFIDSVRQTVPMHPLGE